MIAKTYFRAFFRLAKRMGTIVAKFAKTDAEHFLELVDGWIEWSHERTANARYWR